MSVSVCLSTYLLLSLSCVSKISLGDHCFFCMSEIASRMLVVQEGVTHSLILTARDTRMLCSSLISTSPLLMLVHIVSGFGHYKYAAVNILVLIYEVLCFGASFSYG